jgi:hypothetical protein
MKERIKIKPQFFVPKILKRVIINRKEKRGYPNCLKKAVAKTIAPKKRISWAGNSSDKENHFSLNSIFLFLKNRFKIKRVDKTISKIPKSKGNIPVPGILKFPMGILKDRKVVTAPKIKITIPPIMSSRFNIPSPLIH